MYSQGYKHCVLTPNIAELGRLAKGVGVELDGPIGAAWQESVPQVITGSFRFIFAPFKMQERQKQRKPTSTSGCK